MGRVNRLVLADTLGLFTPLAFSLLFTTNVLAQNTPIAAAYLNQVRPVINGNLAYDTTDFVEDYWRVAGNTGFNATIHRIAQQLEKAGYILEEKASIKDSLTYRIEARPMEHPTWEPISGFLKISGAKDTLLHMSTNRNMVYLHSVATPAEGVTAEIVNVDMDQKAPISGKIVYTETRAGHVYDRMVKEGAIGIITYNNPNYLKPEKHQNSIQFRSLPPQDPTGLWGIALSFAANEELKKAMAKGQTQVKVQLETKRYPSKELTLVANIRGSSQPKERLVFSAHVQEPGANDNASGVGVQLEMAVATARLLQQKSISLNRSLTFLWGDEIISTRRYIADDAQRAKGIKWGISLDMVGENTTLTGGSFLIEKMPDPSAIWTRGKDQHTEWGGEVLRLEDMAPHYLNDIIISIFQKQGNYAQWKVNTNPFEGGSDHTPFLDANIPGLLLWHFTDEFYHTDQDRIDKVSKTTLRNVATGALASALYLLNADTPTAHEILQTIETAALERLKDEWAISAQSRDPKAEKAILDAWGAWYLQAMATVSELEPVPTKEFRQNISEAQKKWTAQVAEQIAALEKL